MKYCNCSLPDPAWQDTSTQHLCKRCGENWKDKPKPQIQMTDLDRIKQALEADAEKRAGNYKDYLEASWHSLGTYRKHDFIQGGATYREMIVMLAEALVKAKQAIEGELTYDPMVDKYKLKQWQEYQMKPALEMSKEALAKLKSELGVE